jgi:ketosteroid isomerase-like protein
MSSRATVASYLACWSVQDVDMALQHFDDDIVCTLYVSEAALSFGGETRGKANVRNVLYGLLAQFDYLKHEPTIVAVEGDVVRVQVQFVYHHRDTGGNLAGSKRLVFTVKNDLIVRVEEFHDAAMVEAFMRLTADRARTMAAPDWPEQGPARRRPRRVLWSR